MKTLGTECSKCGEPMPSTPKGHGLFAHLEFTCTDYRCEKCGHWNDLKRRGKRKTKGKEVN